MHTILNQDFGENVRNALDLTKNPISFLAKTKEKNERQFTDCSYIYIPSSVPTELLPIKEPTNTGETQFRRVYFKNIYWIEIDGKLYINSGQFSNKNYQTIMDHYNNWWLSNNFSSQRKFSAHLNSGGYAAMGVSNLFTFVKAYPNSDAKVIDVITGQTIQLTSQAVDAAELIAKGSGIHLSLEEHEQSTNILRSTADSLCVKPNARVFRELLSAKKFARSPSTGELFWADNDQVYKTVFDMTTAPSIVTQEEDMTDDAEIVIDSDKQKLIAEIISYKQGMINPLGK